ncbi:hypothetical protein T02_5962 [Trichinella nativa]|uniref:Uncharacterized protein n=1 Tax=Trichinella nativa TaxID=6335 RepID=A0A0V1LU10_9BILA|nr:hypothetical protein T02_5962 [Trichinella nativa]
MDCMLPCVWKIDPAFGLRSISETGMNEQLKRFQNLLVQARREKLTRLYLLLLFGRTPFAWRLELSSQP